MTNYRPRNRAQTIAAGLSAEMKACRRCGEEKPLMHFSPRRDLRGGLSNICRSCLNKAASEKTKQKNREYFLRRLERPD
jgi:recombinational DNA repair protein (RecF pathway)